MIMRATKTIYFFAYALLSLLVFECMARIDDQLNHNVAFFKTYTFETIFQPAPFGQTGIPGARFSKWQMNRLGFRGPDPLQGQRNILTFGASETFGIPETEGKEYPRALERLLNKSGDVQRNVINIAQPGMRIGRVSYLGQAIAMTQPEAVIIYPSPANYIGRTAPLCGKDMVPSNPSIALADKSRLKGKVEPLVKTLLPPDLMLVIRKLAIWSETYGHAPMAVVPEVTISAFRADLDCVVAFALSRGVRPILVTHATYFGKKLKPEDLAMLLAWRRYYPTLANEGFLDLERRANDVIRGIGEITKVTVVDAAETMSPGPGNFSDFVHFTDDGAERFAKLIASGLSPTAPKD